jgi:hypothetical protein
MIPHFTIFIFLAFLGISNLGEKDCLKKGLPRITRICSNFFFEKLGVEKYCHRLQRFSQILFNHFNPSNLWQKRQKE